MLSARAGLETKVAALKGGADDYLTKPFEPEEVLARVYAALRRYKIEAGKTEKDTEVYRYKKLRLHPDSRKAEIGGQELPLTMHEMCIRDSIFASVNVTALVLELAEMNCEVLSMNIRDESLESYYVSLVGGGSYE